MISDHHLAVAIKCVSMRNQNLNRALTMTDPKTEKYLSLSDQADETKDALDGLEAEQSERRHARVST
jgi:hypothetical protein